MQEDLKRIRHLLDQLWFAALAREHGVTGDVTLILAKCSADLLDAERMIATPGLKQVNCCHYELGQYAQKRAEGDEYWHVHKSGTNDLLCGLTVPLEARVIPNKCVPTCPECIRRFLAGER